MTLHDAIIIQLFFKCTPSSIFHLCKLNMVKPSKPLRIVFKVKMLGKKKSDGV